MTNKWLAKTTENLIGLSVLASLALGSGASAATIYLDFNSLPSASGWTYTGQPGVSESEVFSISGGVLSQNTIGRPDGYYSYFIDLGIDSLLPYSFEFTARLIEQGGDSSRNLGALGFYAIFGGIGNGVILQPGIIQDFSELVLSTSVDTTLFHTCRMDVSSNGDYQLFVDGFILGSGSAFRVVSPSGLSFGDGTFVVSASGEISSFEFNQITPVPVSAALPLFATALFGLDCVATVRRLFSTKIA